MDAAEAGLGIGALLPRLLDVTQDAETVTRALALVEADETRDPSDPVLLRTAGLLRAALGTAAFRRRRAQSDETRSHQP
jgi:hypothetical protein